VNLLELSPWNRATAIIWGFSRRSGQFSQNQQINCLCWRVARQSLSPPNPEESGVCWWRVPQYKRNPGPGTLSGIDPHCTEVALGSSRFRPESLGLAPTGRSVLESVAGQKERAAFGIVSWTVKLQKKK
jgi:hypothetical protein